MRFEQQISARLKSAVVCAAALALFASGRAVSASGQAPAAPQPQAAAPSAPAPAAQKPAQPAPRSRRVPSCNSARTTPSAWRWRTTWASGPSGSVRRRRRWRSRRRARTTRPWCSAARPRTATATRRRIFLTGNNFVTNDGFRSNAGVAQLLKWGGGSYQASLDGSRNTTSDPTDPFNPRLSSNFNFNFTQPLLRNFTIDSDPPAAAGRPEAAGDRRPAAAAAGHADVARPCQERVLRSRRGHRTAEGVAGVAGSGQGIAQEQRTRASRWARSRRSTSSKRRRKSRATKNRSSSAKRR